MKKAYAVKISSLDSCKSSSILNNLEKEDESMQICESKFIMNHEVFYVAKNTLIACFDASLNIDLINELCLDNPLKLVLRESCFKTDNDKINVFERIKKLSPNTEIHVL